VYFSFNSGATWIQPTYTWASAAMVGSFCLFCENGDTGLPVVISVSGEAASAMVDAAISAPAITPTGIAVTLRIKSSSFDAYDAR
jgi:hypothetical protein